MPVSMPVERQCKAHLRDGSGRRCTKPAIKGGKVCASHGGSAPQVKKSARQRLIEAADPAVSKLISVMENSFDEKTAITAARYILDRAGFAPKSSVELSGPGGGPIQHEDRSGSWFEYCTLEEKRIVKNIAEKAEARRREEVGEMMEEERED